MLLDLYRRGGLSSEYTGCSLPCAKNSIFQVPGSPAGIGKSLEDYEHIASRVAALWGKQECMDYLYN